ncbi:hypothetical protein HMPREF0880_00696 [Yokenella regensburgei ATCC 43003]|nr:hypothetical protein HMPREF0880_00696 [Yokenella regensburgei ATCC 43003]
MVNCFMKRPEDCKTGKSKTPPAKPSLAFCTAFNHISRRDD